MREIAEWIASRDLFAGTEQSAATVWLQEPEGSEKRRVGEARVAHVRRKYGTRSKRHGVPRTTSRLLYKQTNKQTSRHRISYRSCHQTLRKTRNYIPIHFTLDTLDTPPREPTQRRNAITPQLPVNWNSR
jgi:hypothetical protein